MEHHTNASFGTTSKTLIGAIQNGAGESKEAALAELVRLYWPPVYAFLRMKGLSRDDALDTTQSFFSDKVIEHALFDRFDPTRGRLRALLRQAAANFLIDRHRQERARTRRIDCSLDAVAREESLLTSASSTNQATADNEFDRRWALALLEEAIRRTRRGLVRDGKEAHWRAFDQQVLRPLRYGGTGYSQRELVDQLGFNTPAHVGSAVQITRRRLMVALQQVVAESLSESGDEEDELALILRAIESGC